MQHLCVRSVDSFVQKYEVKKLRFSNNVCHFENKTMTIPRMCSQMRIEAIQVIITSLWFRKYCFGT